MISVKTNVETETTMIATVSNLPEDNPDACDQTNAVEITKPPLYEGPSLSTESSHLLLKSYMCRHHLTGQAKEDLLQLLRLHLPKENWLLSSMYLFQKHSDQNDITTTSTYRHYCPHCYTAIPNSATIKINVQMHSVVWKSITNHFLTS